jgi:hypothetical protein
MLLAIDQDPVGALGPCGAYPPLGVAVRARCLRRSLDYPDTLGGENLVEYLGELRVAVPDEEAERAGPVTEVHHQIAGLLSGPCPVRVSGHAEDVHVPGCYFHDEQHVQPPEEDGVEWKKPQASRPCA